VEGIVNLEEVTGLLIARNMLWRDASTQTWRRSVDGGGEGKEGNGRERSEDQQLNKSRSSGGLDEEGGIQKCYFLQESRGLWCFLFRFGCVEVEVEVEEVKTPTRVGEESVYHRRTEGA
jgi:hypothetical protein